MNHYRTNVPDLEFNLLHMVPRWTALAGQPASQPRMLDPATVRQLLRAVDEFARTELAGSLIPGDREPPVFTPETGQVSVGGPLREAFRTLDASGYRLLGLPAELGGQTLPEPVLWSLLELLIGANPALWMYAAGTVFAETLYREGTPVQRRWARLMVDRGWAATMVLTEPDAGSDVGAARTRAHPQPDGSWRIEGTKRFISGGGHDLTENIIHFVLARPAGAGPGVKNLSLFVVPAMLFDDDGSISARNGVRVTSVADKLGLRGSATCELRFGGEHPAAGWLLGDVHQGIKQVFRLVTRIRMVVGVKAVATLSSAYLTALDYATHRLQGAELAASDPAAPRVPIIRHPDIRRSLLLQKATVEGVRALVAYAAVWRDLSGKASDQPARVAELLLPVVKGYASERCCDLLGTEAMGVLGGSGYLKDYPLEQYLRDSRVDTVYEGTTAIQSLDLLLRGLARDDGATLSVVLDQIAKTCAEPSAGLEPAVTRLRAALADFEAIAASARSRLGGPAAGMNLAALHARRLLLAFGDLLVGWLLIEQAVVATTLGTGSEDLAAGKVAIARFFTAEILPRLAADRATVEFGDQSALEVPDRALGPRRMRP